MTAMSVSNKHVGRIFQAQVEGSTFVRFVTCYRNDDDSVLTLPSLAQGPILQRFWLCLFGSDMVSMRIKRRLESLPYLTRSWTRRVRWFLHLHLSAHTASFRFPTRYQN